MSDELKQVRSLLETPLDSDQGNNLRSQLSLRSAWQARISVLYRQAEKNLKDNRNRWLEPKQAGITDMDRTIRLEAATASEEKVVGELKDIANAISTDISLGQSMLRSIEGEIKGNLR